MIPQLLQLPARHVRGIDTFAGLPIVLAHGGGVRAVGKGDTTEMRQRSAVGEWRERTALYASEPEIFACTKELGKECLPPLLFGVDAEQERPDHVLAYDPDTVVGWIQVEHVGNHDRRWLHQSGWNDAGFSRPTSNGAACARTPEAALSAAVAELLERHAFIAWWYRFGAATSVQPISGSWLDLVEWFASRNWTLEAHLLATLTLLPVVLSVAYRTTPDGEWSSAIVGLGTSNATNDNSPIDVAACSAALEIVQAQETMALIRSAGEPIRGDLAAFLHPAGARLIRERLSGVPDRGPDAFWSADAVAAAATAGIDLWTNLQSLDTPGWVLARAFSPDTLPFPSTGRGRRLDHPVLRRHLHNAEMTLADVPPLPHPLG